MKNRQRSALIAAILSLALLIALNWATDPASAWGLSRDLPRRGSGPRTLQAPARATQVLPWDDGARRGAPVVLKWDQLGSMTLGIGLGASYGVQSGQALMRFGGGPTTTQLMPLIQPVALSWSVFTCTTYPCQPRVPRNNRVNLQRVNLWNAVPNANRLVPGSRIFDTVFRSPLHTLGTANTVNTFVVKTFSGAPKFRPSEFFFAGVGVSGPNQPNQFWNFVAEGLAPNANREWFGSGATTAHTIGPTTLQSYGLNIDFGIRVLVAPGVPPELDISTGAATQGSSKVRTFTQAAQ